MTLPKLSNQAVVFFTLFIIGTFSFINLFKWKDYEKEKVFQFSADRAMYYSYLPAFIINDDPFFQTTRQPAVIYDLKYEDRKAVKYTIGMSIMYSPFFLLGYALDPMTDDLAKYGLTKNFSRSIRIGSVIYFLIGLYFLLTLCCNYFDKWVVMLGGLLIFFGTNLMYYLLVEGEMPHVYLFALLSILLYYTNNYWQEKKFKHLLVISIVLALTVLIRPSELILILIPLFWGVFDKESLFKRVHEIKENAKNILLAVILFFVLFLPQFIYWKMLSGNFLIASYSDETFFFLDPKIFDFLFSYRKGWFLYTPLMLFSFIGFFYLKDYVKSGKVILPLIILLSIYICSSWWSWWFAGSFGARSILHLYPLMIFPLMAIISILIKTRARQIVFCVFTFLIIGINKDFTNKYKNGLIHWDSMTKESFWFVFGKSSFTEDDIKTYNNLLETPDYKNAKKGVNR